jgi:hypothetical protein
MMEKSALAGGGGGARPLPFTMSTITNKVFVRSSLEGGYTPPFSNLTYTVCTLWVSHILVLCGGFVTVCNYNIQTKLAIDAFIKKIIYHFFKKKILINAYLVLYVSLQTLL